MRRGGVEEGRVEEGRAWTGTPWTPTWPQEYAPMHPIWGEGCTHSAVVTAPECCQVALTFLSTCNVSRSDITSKSSARNNCAFRHVETVCNAIEHTRWYVDGGSGAMVLWMGRAYLMHGARPLRKNTSVRSEQRVSNEWPCSLSKYMMTSCNASL